MSIYSIKNRGEKMEGVVELVSTFGLSVALCLAFAWFIYKIFTWMREDGIKREEQIAQTANIREEQVRQAAKEREAYAREREERDRKEIEHFSQIISENSRALLKNAEVMEKINANIENISDDVHKLQDDVTEIKYRQINKDK